MLLILLQEVADGIPQSFAYMAVGWAVAVTTGVSGLVLSGKLVLGRELAFITELYKNEKSDREKIETALKETNDELRLQNKTLAATVDVLQRNVTDRDDRARDRGERARDRSERELDRGERELDRLNRETR